MRDGIPASGIDGSALSIVKQISAPVIYFLNGRAGSSLKGGRRRIVQIVFFVISGVDRKNENAIIPSINAFDRGKVTAPRRAKRVPGDGKGAAAGQRSSPRERRAEAEETVRRHGRRRPLSGIEAAAGAAVNDGGTAKAISPFWLCAGRYFCFPV